MITMQIIDKVTLYKNQDLSIFLSNIKKKKGLVISIVSSSSS